MKIAIVRGAFLNQFEMQSFVPLAKRHKLTAFSSLKPIHSEVGFPVVKLLSPMDLIDSAPILQCNGVRRILRGVLNRLLFDAHYLFGLEKYLKGFDIVHSAETYFHYTQQCLNAKQKGWVKRVVCSVSETIPFNNEGIWGRKNFKKRARDKVDLFLARTSLAKKALIEEGCDPKKIIVVPHGVNAKKFPIANCQFPISKKELTILFVGRLEPEKGIKELLEAFRQLTINNLPRGEARRGQQLTIKLKMVGSGRLRDWIKEWIKSNNQCNNITIEQYVYQEVPQIYQAADIFVLPSKKTKNWQEHFGMVLIEAMASSLPIVATRSGAIPEVVGQCGLLVNHGDMQELSTALEELVRDDHLRQKLGKMGRKRVEKYFASREVAAKLEKAYKKSLGV